MQGFERSTHQQSASNTQPPASLAKPNHLGALLGAAPRALTLAATISMVALVFYTVHASNSDRQASAKAVLQATNTHDSLPVPQSPQLNNRQPASDASANTDVTVNGQHIPADANGNVDHTEIDGSSSTSVHVSNSGNGSVSNSVHIESSSDSSSSSGSGT